MIRTSKDKITPGGQSTHCNVATKHSDSGELGLIRKSNSALIGFHEKSTRTSALLTFRHSFRQENYTISLQNSQNRKSKFSLCKKHASQIQKQ